MRRQKVGWYMLIGATVLAVVGAVGVLAVVAATTLDPVIIAGLIVLVVAVVGGALTIS